MKYILGILLLTIATDTLACRCRMQHVTDNFEHYKFIAHAKVVSVTDNKEKSGFWDEAKSKIEVLNLYKGNKKDIPFIVGSNATSAASCNVSVREGEYIVFTNEENAKVTACTASLKLSLHSDKYSVYLLQLLEHLSKQSQGKVTNFKPRLDFRKVLDVLQKHRESINSLYFNHPSNKNIIGKHSITGKVYINKSGYVSHIEFPEKYKVDPQAKKAVETYIKKIKFRESYQNESFRFFIFKSEKA